MQAVEISMSALDVEWTRIQVIAGNIANMNSTGVDADSVFHPLRLLSGPKPGFAKALTESRASFQPTGVSVLSIDEIANGLERTFEPDHPDADAEGFVTRPNISHAEEMSLLIKSSRVYEANLTAMSIAQQMYSRALEIGRRA